MMRSRFDEQLTHLNREMIEMGALCEKAISMASQALSSGNIELAARVAPVDSEIDQMERDIETRCLKLLLQQQPVAKDLRQISAALKMITDLERIGDQAADIAEIVGFLGGRVSEDSTHIDRMAQAAISMVNDAIDAFVKRDLELTEDVISRDDVVDNYFTQIKGALIQMIAENPGDGEYALDLLMIAKYLERIGDHAVNIAEWVQFAATGIHKGAEA